MKSFHFRPSNAQSTRRETGKGILYPSRRWIEHRGVGYQTRTAVSPSRSGLWFWPDGEHYVFPPGLLFYIIFSLLVR